MICITLSGILIGDAALERTAERVGTGVALERQVDDAARPDEGAGSGTPRERVYSAIRDLALELHPAWSGTLVVGPRCDLDRELGYDSLARAELLLRLNRAFGIALPDQLIVEAATAGDVAEAVAAAAPRAAGALPQTAVRATLPEAAAPEDATTLVERLVAHVRAHPDRTHVHLWQGEQVEEALSYGALDRAARTLAQWLVDAGIERGDRVAIMLPTSLGFSRRSSARSSRARCRSQSIRPSAGLRSRTTCAAKPASCASRQGPPPVGWRRASEPRAISPTRPGGGWRSRWSPRLCGRSSSFCRGVDGGTPCSGAAPGRCSR
jgi:hypothetical protein